MLTLVAGEPDVPPKIEVVLEVSPTTFEEIRQQLLTRGTGGTFGEHPRGGQLIELSGVAICAKQSRPAKAKRRRTNGDVEAEPI